MNKQIQSLKEIVVRLRTGVVFMAGLLILCAAAEVHPAETDSSDNSTDDLTPELIFSQNSEPVIYFLDNYFNRSSMIRETDESNFTVVVEGVPGSSKIIDTLEIILSSSSGDYERVSLLETAESTNVYVSEEVPFFFSPFISLHNNTIEGNIDFNSTHNSMSVNAHLRVGKRNLLSSLEITSAYSPVDSAWITDGNGDGQADFIVIRFKKNLPYPPSEVLSIDWPIEGRNKFSARFDSNLTMSEISFFPNYQNDYDSNLVVIHMENFKFHHGDTKTSGHLPASITLPDDVVFRWQAPVLADKICPIISQASHYMGNKLRIGDAIIGYEPDTLLVTFSEKLYPFSMSVSLWDSLLHFTPSGSSNSFPIINSSRPVPLNTDSLTWKFVISSSIGSRVPAVGDEVRINPQAPFTDLAGNPPGWHSDILEESQGNIKKSHLMPVNTVQTRVLTAGVWAD